MAGRQRYDSLQAGRALAACLVILQHIAYFVSLPNLWNRPLLYVHLRGTAFGVQIFFVLSGIVMLTAHWDDLGHASKIPSYLRKRFVRIYPIYWIVLAAVLADQFLVPGHGSETLRSPAVVLSSLLLVHIHSVSTNLVPAWTLFHEVLFYGFFAVALWKKRLGWTLLGLWILLGLLPLSSSPLWQEYFAQIHLLFAEGLLAGWILNTRKLPRPSLFLFAGLFLFGYALYATVPYGLYITGWIPFLAGLGATFGLLGAAELERSQRLTIPRWLNFLGDASYSIYLVQFTAIALLTRLCFALARHIQLPLALWMTAIFLIALAFGCLVHLAIERPLLKWFRSRTAAVAGSSAPRES